MEAGQLIVAGMGVRVGMEVTPTQALENAKNKSYEAKDLWTISLRRVFEFKSGPFFEHSVSRKIHKLGR